MTLFYRSQKIEPVGHTMLPTKHLLRRRYGRQVMWSILSNWKELQPTLQKTQKYVEISFLPPFIYLADSSKQQLHYTPLCQLVHMADVQFNPM